MFGFPECFFSKWHQRWAGKLGQCCIRPRTRRNRFDPRRGKFFFLASASRSALRPPTPLPDGYRGLFPGGKARRGVTLPTRSHLVSRQRMSRPCTSSSRKLLRRVSGTIFHPLESAISCLTSLLTNTCVETFKGHRVSLTCAYPVY